MLMAPNTESSEKYESYHNHDCIYDLKFTYVKGSKYEISFYDDFSWSDDLQVYFRLATEDWSWDDLSPIAVSHFPVGRQTITITEKAFVKRYLYLVEACVRTKP